MEKENLQQQFQQFQDQQKQKLLERRKRKEQANQNIKTESKENHAFGVSDNLDLRIGDTHLVTTDSIISEELVDHLNSEIRQIKDENGRLFKLLSEKDFEIRQLKKKAEDLKNSGLDGPVTNETAATKIIELSKKVRELTSEKESEKTRCKQLQKKCHDLEIELQRCPPSEVTSSVAPPTDNKEDDGIDVKALQERLKQSESRMTDFRNQCQSLRQELKVAHRVLSQELGENVNIQSLLNETSNWRGRAQQILALQQKVEELKVQLDGPNSEVTNTNIFNEKVASARKREEKYREELKRVEKERKEAQENMSVKVKSLEAENENLKEKLDAAKARNKVLANEIKTLKPQVQTLLKKSRNDDEFIDALMKQQGQLKQVLEEHNKMQAEQQQQQQKQLHHMSMKSQQDNNIVEQLKSIAAEKEAQVKLLEMELQHLKLSHAQNHPSYGYHNQHPNPAHVTPLADSRPITANELENVSTRPRVTHSSLSSARSNSRASSRDHLITQAPQVQQTDGANLQYQYQELEIMSRALEVEKDKMTELVKLLQQRLSEETLKLNETQSELQTQKRLAVELEKQLARRTLEASRKRNDKIVYSARDHGTGGDSNEGDDTHIDKNELRTRLEIQKDENESLKAALKRTLQAKEEDLQVYSITLEETKKVFLQALRQMKDRNPNT